MSSDSEADEIDTALRILKRKRKETNKKYNQNKLNSRIRITEQAPVIESSSDSDGYVNNLNNLTQDDLSDFSYLIESDIESDIESEVNESIGLLYNESKTTDSEFLYSLYAIKIKHKLGDSVLNDILFLIKSVLPQPNKCPKSVKGFDKLIPKKSISHFHECCMICQEIKKSDNIENHKLSDKFKCERCNYKTSIFVTFDVQKQLESILNLKNIIQIQHSLMYAHRNKNEIYSALDGEIYKKHVVSSNNLGNLVISFNLNTDGAQIVKHRGYKMWPLLGTITELNQKTREKFDNIVIFGKFLVYSHLI